MLALDTGTLSWPVIINLGAVYAICVLCEKKNNKNQIRVGANVTMDFRKCTQRKVLINLSKLCLYLAYDAENRSDGLLSFMRRFFFCFKSNIIDMLLMIVQHVFACENR